MPGDASPPPELAGLVAQAQGDPASNDKAHRLAWADVQRTDINQKFGPSADPTFSHWINKFHLGNSARIIWGRIVDTVPYVNAYKVQPEYGTPLICTFLAQTSLQPSGARDYGHLQPGTAVFFLLHSQSAFGLIIGTEPEYLVDGKLSVSDCISQAGRSGFAVEDSHKAPFRLDDNSLIGDWSAGRPFDSTSAGEKGWMSATGLGIHLDDFMTFLRVNEETGVWGFYPDDLLRVAGHNLQLWSACREREDLNDEGEVTSIEQYTPFQWEGLGLFRNDGGGSSTWATAVPLRGATAVIGTITYGGITTPITIPNLADAVQSAWDKAFVADMTLTDEVTQGVGQAGKPPPVAIGSIGTLFRDHTDHDWQINPDLQCYSAVEPAADDQQGFYRLRDFFGYLGQAHKRSLQLPPQPVPGFPQTYSNYFQMPGVYEENLSLTGRKSVRTAHEYLVVRSLAIPSPKQMRRQEDVNGDGAGNYKASGAIGKGSNHVVSGKIPNNTGVDDGLIHALGFLDKQSFVFNWEGSHPFEYHRRDWYLPEEGDLGHVPNTSPPAYANLANHTHLPTPAPIPLWVDSRYQNVDYYPGISYTGLTEEGGVIHGDAWGAEVRTHNGNVYIDAPANIYLRAGRNVVIEAGKDVITKAKYSIDQSATLGDYRAKAEHGLYLLGGNDGCGGVLIESKAQQPAIDFNGKQGEDATLGGIVLKASTSMIGMCSNLHIITADCATKDDPALLINMPGGRVRVLADFIERFLTSAAFDVFITGDSCSNASATEAAGSQTTYPTLRGPQDGSSASTSGPNATVPLLAGITGPAGPINTGFYGQDVTPTGGVTFTPPAVTYANEFWSGKTTINGVLRVAGQILATDSIYANGDFCTVHGHFFSPRANTVAGRITTLKGDTLTAVQQAVSYTQSRNDELFDIAEQELNTMLAYPINLLSNIAFSYRSVPQYKTADWTVPEPRWNQLNRAAKRAGSGTTAVWTEKPVWTTQGTPTYPYPGYERWVGATSLLTMDTALINLDNGLAYDRSGGLYETPHYGNTVAVVPDGNYPTIF